MVVCLDELLVKRLRIDRDIAMLMTCLGENDESLL